MYLFLFHYALRYGPAFVYPQAFTITKIYSVKAN